MRVFDWKLVQQQWIAVAIAFIGTLVCAALTWLQWDMIRMQREVDVTETINSYRDAFRTEVKRAEDLQDTVVAFFETSGNVGREQFEAFAAKLPSVHIKAISFAAHVPAAKRAEFERTMRADTGTVSRIWERDAAGQPRPAADRDAYFPVTYLYPPTGNLAAVGFDLVSEPRRKRALLAAIETGKTVRTEPIRLVQDPEHWAFLVFKPVYAQPKHAALGNARQPELAGIVSAVYQYKSFQDAVVSRLEIAQHVALFDTTQPSSPVTVHYSRALPHDRPDLEHPLTVIASAAGARSVSVVAMQHELSAVFFSAGVGATFWRQINAAILATLVVGLLLTAALVWNHVRAYRLAVRLNEATEELRLKKENAEKASVAKSRFLAAASHDLRQPMHALGFFTDSLHAEIGGQERVRNLLDRIQNSVDSMVQMFDVLLDVSLLDADVIKRELQDFPVQTLLTHLETLFSPLAIDHGLRFSVVASSAWVRSDPTLLRRLVQNLVSNAIKYTRAGGVVIGCRRHANALSIEVWDSGPGIAPEHQVEIFREFAQLENPKHDRSKGLGLGLAIVERMSGLLGHPIRLRSVVGRGSVFAVEVPYGDAARGVAVPLAIQDAIDPFAGVRVAVIDDEPEVLDATMRLLERWGCVVVGAGSEAEMLELLSGETAAPDFLISDYHLGDGQDGLCAIRNVRLATGKKMPAILISGDIGNGHAEQARASRIDLLQKPVAPARLRQVMRRLVPRQSGPDATWIATREG